MKCKNNKIMIVIALYAVILLSELLFFVPYEKIEIFRSEQNVPHITVIGNGYTDIFSISKDNAVLQNKDRTATGKRVNTTQIITNIFATTVIAAAVYFLYTHKNEANNDLTKTPISNQHIINEQVTIFDEMCKDELDEIMSSEPLSEEEIEKLKEEMKNVQFLTVHTLSSRNGYYKDTIEKTEENAEMIDRWLDKTTGCLYMTITYRDNEAKSMFITKEFFDTLYKQFEA